MKKIILFLVIVFAAINTLTAQQPTFVKVGYVDSEIILAQFSEAIKARSDLEGLVARWRTQADSIQTDLQTSYADYQKQAATMTQEKQREAQQSILEKEQRLQQFREQKFAQPSGEYFVRQEQLMAPVKQKIFASIESIAKEEGMHYVLDKAGEVVVLYADSQFDITYKVLDRLKRGK